MQTKLMAFSVMLVLASMLPLGYAYTTRIHAPAVLQSQDIGALTQLQLNVTPGNGGVYVNGPAYVGSSTTQSAQAAAKYAATFVGVNVSHYNFTYYVLGNTMNVSGPSAGLAFTLLAIYGLESKQPHSNFTVTGTINPDGTVGLVGGVYDKAQVSASGGMKYLVVPNASSDALEELIYYIAQQTFKLPLVQVSNVLQALPYAAGVSPLTIQPISPNLTQSYNLSVVKQSTLVCSQCNMSAFAQLTNFTFNLGNYAIYNISSNYSAVTTQLEQQLALYKQISSKGYLYTGADLAFQQYPYEFLLAESNSYSQGAAYGVIYNVSGYCDGLTPPQLTNLNYEYVVGGELRQALAQVSVGEAYNALNTSQSTDDIINALSTTAEAYAWCRASNEMYSIATNLGGTPVQESVGLMNPAAAAAVSAAAQYPGIYAQAAQIAYNNSEYSAALYAATYARTFRGGFSPANYTSAEASLLQRQATNDTYGIWPTEFADSALFYLQQLNASKSSVPDDINNAYSLALLASNLNSENRFIAGNLTSITQASPPWANSSVLINLVINQSQQLSSLQTRVDTLLSVVQFLSVLVVLMLMVLMFLFVRELHRIRTARRVKPAGAAQQRRRHRSS